MVKASEKTIGRLILYRRVLQQLLLEGTRNIYSHELARRTNLTAAQVRRDLMAVGYSGSPVHGYDVQSLLDSIGGILDPDDGQEVAIVGVGNLGRAILAYFSGRRPKLNIVAAFDRDPLLSNRVIHGCRCYPMTQFNEIIQQRNIKVGILTIPAEDAQTVCDLMVRTGIKGILNFAPVRLHVPSEVYVEHMDMAMVLEKVAYFSRGSS